MDRFKINPSSSSGGRLIEILPAGSGLTTEALASVAAKLTLEAFDAFSASFKEITARASRRFADKDWVGGQNDASDRLDLYERALDRVADHLGEALGSGVREQATWAAARKPFAVLVANRYDVDRAETFFN
jgi:isocitrate dehydrogenase kinase/phosphatase